LEALKTRIHQDVYHSNKPLENFDFNLDNLFPHLAADHVDIPDVEVENYLDKIWPNAFDVLNV